MTINKLHLPTFIFTLVLLFTASNLSASGLVRINNYLKTEYSIISIINPSGITATLEITDQNKNIVFTKEISKEACSQEIINFEDVYNGNYTITVSNKNFKSEDRFELINNKIRKPYREFNTEERVFFRIAEEMLFVSRSAVNSNFNLTISDKYNTVIFDEAYVKSTRSKRFNISQLPSGKYNVRLYSGSKEFTYSFVK